MSTQRPRIAFTARGAGYKLVAARSFRQQRNAWKPLFELACRIGTPSHTHANRGVARLTVAVDHHTVSVETSAEYLCRIAKQIGERRTLLKERVNLAQTRRASS